ncbi:MAG: restriction endonuclease subunit S [Opitutaceae bacterium]|nr:restriction endonuclease subunit S [Opitutaceae bacterium]
MVPLGEIGRWFGGGTPSKANPKYWTGGTIPWVSPKDMKQPLIDDAQDHITAAAVSESSTNMVEVGSVLVVARSGILQHTLPVAITTRRVALNQDIKAVEPRKDVAPEFLALALKAFEREILHTCTKTGTTVQSLELPVFQRFQIPVPSLSEQRRIVAEIEKQLTRLDAGVAALRRTQANLKRYRTAVLKAACEGGLVPRESGHWKQMTLEDACSKVTDGDHQPPPKVSDGIPFLTIGNISSGRLDFSDTRFVPSEYFAQIKADRVPQTNDVLYSVVGATIGIPVLVNTERQFCFQRHIALLKPSPAILPKFLWAFMASPRTFREAWAKTTGGMES